MLSNKKPSIEKYLEPFVEPISGVNPNILTLIGSIPPLLFFVFVILHMYLWALIGFFGTIFDMIDGMVARKYNKVTKFGGFFDSLIDRVGDFLFISAFSYSGIIRWEISAPILLFAFLTSYIRSRAGLAANDHMEFAVGIIERPERLGFIFVALVSHILWPTTVFSGFSVTEWIFVLLAILSLVTIIQRVRFAYTRL